VTRRAGIVEALRRAAWRLPAVVGVAAALSTVASAQTLAPLGCPVFHCTVEATGVMDQPLIQTAPTFTYNNTLGTMKAQACSGDSARLACLFATDTTVGAGKGTLKLLNATTLQPIWGSYAAPNSYNLDAASSSGGQAPLIFANGDIAAGDKSRHVRYNSAGGVVGNLPLTGKGNNFGLTPISDTYGIVTQTDGILTLVNMSTWQALNPLPLVDPTTHTRLQVVSPSSATGNVLYVVAQNPQTLDGYLFSVVMNTPNQKPQIRSTYKFSGQTQASPVIVEKAITNWQANLILLHVPGLNGDRQNRLVGLKDNGQAFVNAWAPINLTAALPVSPSIDQTTKSVFFEYKDDWRIFQYNFMTGAAVKTYDIRAIGGFPQGFVMNGHMGATQTGSTYTMLLGGAISSVPGSNGQYIMAFTPVATPTRLLWSKKVRTTADQYLAAWNLAPSSHAGIYCPTANGPLTGLTRICDF
jgi:hypothetical protein